MFRPRRTTKKVRQNEIENQSKSSKRQLKENESRQTNDDRLDNDKLENETQRSEKQSDGLRPTDSSQDIDHVGQPLLGYGLLNSLVGGGECYNTTCSPSWLAVSPLIPLREFGDDAFEHTPLSGTAGDYRVTICFASLGDLQSQPRSEGIRAADRPGPPSGFRPQSEVDPNVHVALTPETCLYVLTCRTI